MTKRDSHISHCPVCGMEKIGRKRDVGKMCKSCNMKNVEKQYRHTKIKENKLSASEYSKARRKKYENDDKFRLSKLLDAAKVRAKRKNIICDLTIDDLFEIFPKDRICPVLGINLFWGNSGKGNRNNSPSIDKIDPNGNYTKDNVCIISWRANMLKSDATFEEIESIYFYMKS
jgi:hypothetical protein